MKGSVNERFKKVVDENKFSATYLSKIAGISQTTISRQIKGDYNVSIESVNAVLHELPKLSADWLLTGRGQMYVEDNLPAFNGNESENELELQAEMTKRTIELEECKERLAEAYKTIEDLRYMVSLQKDKIRSLEGNMREEKKVV